MIRKTLWKITYACYPYIRNFLLFSRIMKHSGRQNFHLGFLKQGLSMDDLKYLLEEKGFEKSIMSWIDDDEAMSMRKRANKIYQHHIRLYSDGEIKGHYEYSPESRPRKHLKGEVFEPEKRFFMDLAGDVITSKASSESR